MDYQHKLHKTINKGNYKGNRAKEEEEEKEEREKDQEEEDRTRGVQKEINGKQFH